MLIRKLPDPHAISSCTLDSNSAKVICDRRAGWSGLLHSYWTITREVLALDFGVLGPQGQSATQCPD